MQKYLLSCSLMLAALAGAQRSHAQLIDCDVFLKGNHLEIGINSNGAFGTSVEAPATYHANVTDTMYEDCVFMSNQVFLDLGFVADPNLTGWASYYGDFIMPGNPREGWAMYDAAGSATAYSYSYHTGSSGFTGPLAGSNIAYTPVGTQLTGTWAGAFHSSLSVQQVTTIDTGNLYMKVRVGFYNTSLTPDSFYYLRFVNPHNEAVGTGNMNTKAKIEHQLPNADGLVVVSASGIADTMSYIALGTRDPRAKCFITIDSNMPGPGTLAAIWAGDPTHYNYNDTLTGDHAIGIVYKIGVGAGDSSFLDYGYSFKGGIIDTALDSALIDTSGTGGGGGGGGTLRNNSLHQGAIAVFPNPAADVLNITGMVAASTIAIFDITGREMSGYTTTLTGGNNSIQWSGLPNGIYFIRISDQQHNVLARIPVTKQ